MHASTRALLRPSGARRLLATSSKATPARSAPFAVAHDAHSHDGNLFPAPVSSGELAWCEVYGVDYARLRQDALDESPLALNTPAPHTDAAATPSAQGDEHDIWSVIFGTNK